ncbi:MAG: DivIVA domain-containing protein [Dermatophilaceae bacterium]
MFWVLIVVVAVVIIVAVLAMLAGRLPYDGMAEPVHTTPPVQLPRHPGPDDVAALRFDTALRGYRMDQVDEALAALQRRIAELEGGQDDPFVDRALEDRVIDPASDSRTG